MLKNANINVNKLNSLNLSVKDDKYDTFQTANITNLGGEILLSDLQRCYQGSANLHYFVK
jgi:hypothetical protein